MKVSQLALLKGTSWTAGAYAISQILRILLNFALTRILAPEAFGIMAVVNSVKTGIDLISDVGIETNIVHNKKANQPEFYNTAWSLQILRGIILWILLTVASFPLAAWFELPILQQLLPVAGLYLAIAGFLSVGRFLAQKELQIARINVFELTIDSFSTFVFIILAIVSPNVWALIFAGLIGTTARTVGSYFILRSVEPKFYISLRYGKEIFGFGKWIFVSSSIYFLAMSFDRLYLGAVAPLGLLGVYGIARALSEPFAALIIRIGNYVVFPTIASASQLPRANLRKQLGPIRFLFLLFVIVGLAFLAATADLAVKTVYDERYQAVSWMLPPLVIGTWFSIISSLNESTLLGLGKPSYAAYSNMIKLAYILLALPLAFKSYGMLGAVVVMAGSDLFRYLPAQIGMIRERFSFWFQDFLLTVGMMVTLALFEWWRWKLGYGTSFDNL